MIKTKVFSSVIQIVNGISVRLQNYCLGSNDTLGVRIFAAVKHWLVPFGNLQREVSLKKIGFFPTGPGVSLCPGGVGLLPKRVFPSLSSCCSAGGLLPGYLAVIPAQLARCTTCSS